VALVVDGQDDTWGAAGAPEGGAVTPDLGAADATPVCWGVETTPQLEASAGLDAPIAIAETRTAAPKIAGRQVAEVKLVRMVFLLAPS
jgi:hypothetical protein